MHKGKEHHKKQHEMHKAKAEHHKAQADHHKKAMKHADAKEDKKLVKHMVKKSSLK